MSSRKETASSANDASAEAVATYAAKVREFLRWEVAELHPKAVVTCLERRRFLTGVVNLRDAAKCAIEEAMICITLDKDAGKAKASLKTGADFSTRWFPKYLEAIRAAKNEGLDLGQEGRLPRAVFKLPLFCCLLLGDWSLVSQWAAWALEPEVVMTSDMNDDLTLLYVALVLDDRQRFQSVKLNPKQLDKRVEKPYPAAAQAIMARDQAAFDRFLEEIEADFAARALPRQPEPAARPRQGGPSSRLRFLRNELLQRRAQARHARN